jgi:uncharacterized protein
VYVGASLRSRLLGLALLRRLPERCALLLPGCRSVHTTGMRFPLDLVWLDAHSAVVRVDRAVAPWRVVACREADAVVELHAGLSPASRPARSA